MGKGNAMPITIQDATPKYKVQMTPGLYKAITRNGLLKVHSCGFPVLRYPGAYPKKCPVCQGDLKDEVSYPTSDVKPEE
jgi:hypothetical protein